MNCRGRTDAKLEPQTSGPVTSGESSAEWIIPESLRLLAQSEDDGMLSELIELFCSDTASRLETLHHAYIRGDMAQVRLQAHAIKGGAFQVGAIRVAEWSRQLELASAQKSPTEMGGLLSRLQASFERVRRTMACYGAGARTAQ